MADLLLIKGYNNGIFQGVVEDIDEDGNTTPFNLTSATVTLEIYERTGEVKAQIAGSVVTAGSGIYSAFPDADDLTNLTPGAAYFWRVKVVNATYPQGKLFARDSDGNYRTAVVMGSSSGT